MNKSWLISILVVFPKLADAVPTDLQELRESTRSLVMSRSCVNCHTPGGVGSRGRILDIYNLKNTYWSSSMDDKRLQAFENRMNDQATPQDLPKTAKNLNQQPLSKRERSLISSFVNAELEFRKSFPQERQREIEQNKKNSALSLLGFPSSAD